MNTQPALINVNQRVPTPYPQPDPLPVKKQRGSKSHKKSSKNHKRGLKSHKRGLKSHKRGLKSHKRGSKSHKKSHKRDSKSHKKSHKRGSKKSHKNIYSVENMMRYFYEMTVKNLTNEHKASINIDKSRGIMYGTASREELVKMPWMYCVKPLWTVAPGPYTFRINFDGGKNGEKIKKTLSIYNGTVNLFPNSSVVLNDLLMSCKIN